MTLRRRLRSAAAEAWLGLLYWCTANLLWLPRLLRSSVWRGVWLASPTVRRGTLSNASHILGAGATRDEKRALARATLRHYYDTVVEFGMNRRRTRQSMLEQLESVEGEERYKQARRKGNGAILVTAHMGPFEAAMAMLSANEPRVHVVFRRDPSRFFEQLRCEQHRKLGVIEAPIDEGLSTWFRLRDALARDEVVLMQADRVLPGQPGVAVPFLGGRLLMPTGPVKLARLTGAPLIPVFALRGAGGKVRIFIEEPIDLTVPWAPGLSLDPGLLALAAVLGRYVRAYPDQWLSLHPCFSEDPYGAAAAQR